MKSFLKPLSLFLISNLLFFVSCDKDLKADPEQKSLPVVGLPTVANIPGSSASFDAASLTYTLAVPAGTDIKALRLNISLIQGATISPDPTIARDYTTPLRYTITHDEKKYQITVKAEVSSSGKSSAKQITTFRFSALNAEGQIDHTNHKIIVRVADTQDVTNLVPSVIYSLKALSVSPASGVAQNFTNPVNYTVTAEDGSIQVYEVRVEKVNSTIGKNVLYYMGYEETTEGEVYSVKYHTGYLIAINADTGEEIWRSKLGKIEPDVYAFKPLSTPTIAKVFEDIHVVYGNYIYIINEIGTKLREFYYYEAAISSGPYMYNNSVYYSANIGFGEWQGFRIIKLAREVISGNYTIWSSKYLNGIGAGLGSDVDIVYAFSFGSRDNEGVIKAYDLRSEGVKWEYKYSGGDSQRKVTYAINKDLVFIQKDEAGMDVLDKQTGNLKFQIGYRHTGYPIAVKDDVLFFFRDQDVNGKETRFFCSYDTKAGKNLWEKEFTRSDYQGGVKIIRFWEDMLLIDNGLLVDIKNGNIISQPINNNWLDQSVISKDNVYGGRDNFRDFTLYSYDLSSHRELYNKLHELPQVRNSNLLVVDRTGEVYNSKK